MVRRWISPSAGLKAESPCSAVVTPDGQKMDKPECGIERPPKAHRPRTASSQKMDKPECGIESSTV